MCEPRLDARELEYVTDCVRTGWISSAGPYLDRFENAWAAYCGRRDGVAVFNGTVALEAAVRCLELRPGDEVILPTFTIISCALAVLRGGAHPVLVDADPDTWCLDVGQVEDALTPRTRAIMPVHIYGHPVDMDPLLELADQHDLVLIEDAAEAHGGQYLRGWRNGTDTWQTCGSFGVVSCFSFYANKIISTGEGGMVLTDDPALARRLRSLRNLYFEPERRLIIGGTRALPTRDRRPTALVARPELRPGPADCQSCGDALPPDPTGPGPGPRQCGLCVEAIRQLLATRRDERATPPELVQLRDGPSVPAAALRLLLKLEDCGCEVQVTGGMLVVSGEATLTAADHAAIDEQNAPLIQLVMYCERSSAAEVVANG